MRRIPALAMLWPLLLGLAAVADAGELASVQVIEAERGTQAVLSLSDDAQYRLFTLANPDRLVLDLEGTALAEGFRAPAPNGLVAGVRTGTPAAGQLRVVFDLSRD